MALTCLKGGTECGNNRVKKTTYPAPAAKGFRDKSFLQNGRSTLIPASNACQGCHAGVKLQRFIPYSWKLIT